MKMYVSLVSLALLLAAPQKRWEPTQQWLDEPQNYGRPTKGFVRQKETAIRIGSAIVSDIYGKSFEKSKEPFEAKLFGDVWVVYGYLPLQKSNRLEDIVKGGVTTVQISASTGTILNVDREL